MKEKTGTVFCIHNDVKPLPGLTVSCPVSREIIYFALARNTDISAEIYPESRFIILLTGQAEVYTPGENPKILTENESIITKKESTFGVRAKTDAVYVEINTGRNYKMNENVKAGEVFKLSELVPYQEGRIINMDVVSNSRMKFVVMSFDEGTGLSEHAAPGEALIFALDGEGIIGYEGKEHVIHAGENFHFAKGGLHSVKAVKKFKMALLLTLE